MRSFMLIVSILFIALRAEAQEMHLLANPYPAPEFVGIDSWINSPPLTMQSLRGKVVLVDFWTYSCINCVRTLPYLTAWDARYRDKGLVIIGVSTPEFDFESKPDNVQAAITKYGIHYPVALDNHQATWANFHNPYWPAHYLINKQGNVVDTHFGEGDYAETEKTIRFLLGITDPMPVAQIVPETAAPDQTHETYLGYARKKNFIDGQPVVRNAESMYQYSSSLPLHHWSLNGKWMFEAQKIVSGKPGAALQLNFKARKVFLVLGTATGKPIPVSLTLNGLPPDTSAGKDATSGTVTVDKNTLYELIDQKTATEGQLEIKAGARGLEAYAFTFGG